MRLYVRGTNLGYKRTKSNQYKTASLVQIEGVNTREDVAWYCDKRMTYVYKAKTKRNGTHYRCIWGKVSRPHGNIGVVCAMFTSNLYPPRPCVNASVSVVLDSAEPSLAQESNHVVAPIQHEDADVDIEKPLENDVPPDSVVGSPVCLESNDVPDVFRVEPHEAELSQDITVLFATLDPLEMRDGVGHYCEVALNVKERQFEFLDSLNKPGSSETNMVFRRMGKYIKRAWKEGCSSSDELLNPPTLDGFSLKHVVVPIQPNGLGMVFKLLG
ncbi:60S ribosomal protein L35a-3 [Hordeum vulgare]|nr:60S ribosomal protein L35a-3 [Hordeum vulgare]